MQTPSIQGETFCSTGGVTQPGSPKAGWGAGFTVGWREEVSGDPTGKTTGVREGRTRATDVDTTVLVTVRVLRHGSHVGTCDSFGQSPVTETSTPSSPYRLRSG